MQTTKTMKTRKTTPATGIRLARQVLKGVNDTVKKHETEMEALERQFLETCRELFNEDKGCTTPFHDFFRKLVSAVQYGRWPSPEDVREDLEEFEANWEDMRRDAKIFLCQYPEPSSADLKRAA